MNEKFLIEQKLHQSYLIQMDHLLKLKFSILENTCCHQQKNVIIKKSTQTRQFLCQLFVEIKVSQNQSVTFAVISLYVL